PPPWRSSQPLRFGYRRERGACLGSLLDEDGEPGRRHAIEPSPHRGVARTLAMAPPKRFNLLIVRGDGSRVLRASAPRWAVHVALGGLAVAIVAGAISIGAFYADYVSLRHRYASLDAFVPRLAEHQALLDASRERVRGARAEIESWHRLHEKI